MAAGQAAPRTLTQSLEHPGDLPDAAAAMARWLPTSPRWEAVQAFASLDSTQAQTRRDWLTAAPQEPRGWRLIRAERQTAGRGRQGARWVDAAGGALLMTVSGPVALAAEHWPKLALVAGLAALQTLQPLLAAPQRAELRLKWPNDLVVRTPRGWRKLAGLLTERLELPGGAAVWLCGLGLNVSAVPAELQQSAACLAEVTPAPLPDVDALTGRLAAALAAAARQLAEQRGALPVKALEQHLAFVGERLRVDEGPLHGERWLELRGLTPAGALWGAEIDARGQPAAEARPWMPLALLQAEPSGWHAAPRLQAAEGA